MIDLNPNHLETVKTILAQHVPECEVWVFGSRATWTAKDYSDLDLAIVGKGSLDWRILGRLKEAFEESILPMRVDVLDWHAISQNFREVIERDHVVLVAADSRKPAGQRSDVVSEWREIPFARLLSEQVRNGIYKKKEFHGRGVKIVNMGELFAHSRLRNVHMKRVELSEREKHHVSVLKGDLLFARRSLVAEGAGKCSVVLEIDEPTTFESSIIRARPNPAKADSLFLYYYFNSPPGLHALDSIRRQVAVAGITGHDLVQLDILTPSLPQQRAIAHILGTLDDKIELNRRMNETLEAMARALFRFWFVDFDPVRAKMEGRDPGLPQHLADLFPDRLVDSELGEIPEGWEISTIGEEVSVVGGSTPSTKDRSLWDGAINWATPKDLSALSAPVLIETARQISDAGLSKISSGLLPRETVLLSSRAPIGYLAIADIPVAVNQGFIAMRCEARLPNVFVWLWTQANMDTILQNANGSTFQEISKRNFRPLGIAIPEPDLLSVFDGHVRPLYERIVKNQRESRTRAALRDTLLPKLISDELRVKNAESFIEKIASPWPQHPNRSISGGRIPPNTST